MNPNAVIVDTNRRQDETCGLYVARLLAVVIGNCPNHTDPTAAQFVGSLALSLDSRDLAISEIKRQRDALAQRLQRYERAEEREALRKAKPRPRIVRTELSDWAARTAFKNPNERHSVRMQAAVGKIFDTFGLDKWFYASQVFALLPNHREPLRRLRELRQIGFLVDERRADPNGDALESMYRIREP